MNIRRLKKLNVFAFTILFAFGFTLHATAQGNVKVDKAGNKFCKSADSFIEALGDLDAAAGSGLTAELTTSYNKAVKSWNKMEKSAEKLENVKIKESVKSYNKMVESINKMLKGDKSPETTKEIKKQINATSKEINVILRGSCI